MKISQKLILGFIGFAMLVLIVGYISVKASQRALQESIGQSSSELAAKILEHIDRAVYRRIEDFQELSRDSVVQQFAAESNREFEEAGNIQAYINEKDRQWTNVPKEEITEFIQHITNNELSRKLQDKMAFYNKKYGYNVFGEIFITNKYGANIAQSEKTSDYYQADEQWWQNAKRDGLSVSDVQYDISAGIYSTDICTRIEDNAGDFLGVIKVVLNIEEAINLIKATEKGKTTKFKLINKDGKVIYSTEEFKFFGSLPDKLISDFHGRQGYRKGHYFIANGENAGEGDKLFACAHSKGYKDYKGLGWTLVVEHRTRDIFAPVTELKKIIFAATTAIAILAVVLGLIISRAISCPLDKLTVAANNIGHGDLDTRVNIRLNDEIVRLSASFNKMVDDLRQTTTSVDNLNREINERQKVRAELQRGMEQLEQCTRHGMERQEQVIKLKREVNALLAELGREPRYKYAENISAAAGHNDNKG